MAKRKRGSKKERQTMVVRTVSIGSLTTSAAFSRIWTVKVGRYMATRRRGS
jgi:hypothetical protein